MTKTVFIQQGHSRISYRVKDNGKAYGFASRAKLKGAHSVVIADLKRTKYEEARIDSVTGEVVFRQVNAPSLNKRLRDDSVAGLKNLGVNMSEFE